MNTILNRFGVQRCKYLKIKRYEKVNRMYTKDKVQSTVINPNSEAVLINATNVNDIGIGSNAKFPWRSYVSSSGSIFYTLFKNVTNFLLQDSLSRLTNSKNEFIINFDDIATNSKTLFQEATNSIFRHELIKLHQSNNNKSIDLDVVDSNVTTIINDHNNNSSTSNDINSSKSVDSFSNTKNNGDNNDSNNVTIEPFALTYIFESNLATLYQHAIERFCKNPNLSIHYQLHEVKSSTIYDTEIFLGMSMMHLSTSLLSMMLAYINYSNYE